MRYYTILTKTEIDTSLVEFLTSKLGEEQTSLVIGSLGYSELENLNELTLSECSISTQELEDGTYVCAVNLANPMYLSNKCAIKGMNEAQYQLAVLLYGEENLLTVEERSELNFKTID